MRNCLNCQNFNQEESACEVDPNVTIFTPCEADEYLVFTGNGDCTYCLSRGWWNQFRDSNGNPITREANADSN